jgi:hypothetical protein
MTKNTKIVLIGAAAAALAGGFLLVCVVAVVGFALLSATGEENGGPGKTRAARTKKAPAAPPGALAPELVGAWINRSGGGDVDFTGKTRYRSSRVNVYRFAADGTVEFTSDKDVLTILQCEIKERRRADGRAATGGETLTINFGEADFAASNSCEGGETAEKTLPAETVAIGWRITEEFGAPQLCLAEPEGELCYERQD